MSLNIIGKCALGMDLDALNNRNHPIREAAEELLREQRVIIEHAGWLCDICQGVGRGQS